MTKPIDNPYSAPKADLKASTSDVHAYRDGKFVVVGKNTELPRRCWICNLPAEEKSLIEIMVWISHDGMATNIKVPAFLCLKHERRRVYSDQILSGGWLVLLAIALCSLLLDKVGAISDDVKSLLLIGLGAMVLIGGIASIAVKRWAGARLRVSRADQGRVWLRNAGPPFLESLPQEP